ncbi:helix-hairpin-helix domain-containing protein [Hydrogenophaga sp. PAMC20947]|uniref:ComEA family DNA-binding protein n=1 Tax=Hydrogenophaga sp. PAMC20947 TaxID=2565558 RepID=UPI00109E35F5|nr:helix-hairpin-helix domain-containing protein [Hydrogenophaga sp. PAMC20947]QCB46764.1 helix-hairpin-helix domain-containing protein [Hydrogenophaga sp. PAMC20947]
MSIVKHIIVAFGALLVSAAMAAVDVNTASENDLESIKGIGPSTATKMMAARKQSPFKDWSDLIQRLSGIGERRAAKLSAGGLTVNGAPYKAGTGSGTDTASVASQSKAPQRNLPIAMAPRY